MGGCQNHGPFLDPHYNTAPNIWGTSKRDHNFDNHPYSIQQLYGASGYIVDSDGSSMYGIR